MPEPFPLEPAQIEPRGEFPDHDDSHRVPRFTAEQAARYARLKLELWELTHGD